MGQYSWGETIASAQVAGPVLNTFTTAISCLPTHARAYITPDFWYVGKQIAVRASGGISNVVTAQPTFTFDFRLGPTSNIIVFNGGAMTTSTTAHTLVPWWLDIQLTCRAIGSGTSANLMGQGSFTSRAVLVSGATADAVTTGFSTLMIPATSPAVGTGFDSTVPNIADLFVACQTSNAGNGVTLQQYSLMALN
jgi:hypothetical protein